jgi:uncharacterized protein GlcG (DUF336 family)
VTSRNQLHYGPVDSSRGKAIKVPGTPSLPSNDASGWTARAFDASTEDLAGMTQSGQQRFGLNTTNGSRVVIFGGGIPIKLDGTVIGAVGASGGSVEEDVAVARAALAGLSG